MSQSQHPHSERPSQTLSSGGRGGQWMEQAHAAAANPFLLPALSNRRARSAARTMYTCACPRRGDAVTRSPVGAPSPAPPASSSSSCPSIHPSIHRRRPSPAFVRA
eukprot:scaffold638_cov382-Prasinococcus_capsulatus_cf.AAC.6